MIIRDLPKYVKPSDNKCTNGCSFHTKHQPHQAFLLYVVHARKGSSLPDIYAYTVYGKTFEGENFHGFHGFSANCESFPLESFAVYGT